jgi:hypothetical protein
VHCNVSVPHGKQGEIDGVIPMIDARSEGNNRKDMINKGKYQMLRERERERSAGSRLTVLYLTGTGGWKKGMKKKLT